MARARTLTQSHVLKGLIALSVASCFALPRGVNRPRQWLAPLLAPIAHAGTYVCDSVRRNLADLRYREVDDQTARDILGANPELRDGLRDETIRSLQRRLIAYHQLLARQRQELAELSQTRATLGDDFPCKLVPATIIARDPDPYGRSALARSSARPLAGATVTSREALTDRPTAIPEALAALSGSALVGRVAAGGAWTAHIQLVNDVDFRTRGVVVRMLHPDNPRTITAEETRGGRTLFVQRALRESDPAIPVSLAGDGVGAVSAAIPAHHNILPGDVVVTAGDSDRLPAGIMIGAVSAVEPLADNPKHVQVRVATAVDLEALRRVYLVLPLARRVR